MAQPPAPESGRETESQVRWAAEIMGKTVTLQSVTFRNELSDLLPDTSPFVGSLREQRRG